jgi:hypothetical protein
MEGRRGQDRNITCHTRKICEYVHRFMILLVLVRRFLRCPASDFHCLSQNCPRALRCNQQVLRDIASTVYSHLLRDLSRASRQ